VGLYGLGSLNQNLPTFVVLVATPTNRSRCRRSRRACGQSGYLPGEHAGVSFRSKGDPILFINNPPGRDDPRSAARPSTAEALNEITYQQVGDPRRTPASSSTRWPSACRPACRS
jgi:hypothetical protein